MNVKIARIKKNMSQGELCEITGIGRTTISKIESGEFKNVKLALLVKISKALGESIEYLFLSEEV